MMREERTIPFPEELIHLEETNRKLETALLKAEEDVVRADRDYMDSKRYMADHRGEIDPHEMFQNELLLRQADRIGGISVDIRDRIAKLKDSPYFARIDFQEKGGVEAARYYIGRFAFNYEKEMMIFDWRAPVSGMFYDCETGPAAFQAPSGLIEGEMTRKRQFKIKRGVMEYALESSANVQDDVLQRELSHTSDEKMKSIISTIQKEQNRIIRSERENTMIIQGVAGSGKTSIALHRIAYLLYRFKNRLSARNVAIISPNKVFGDYISGVIPELGEEPVFELGLDDIAGIQLERVIGFVPAGDPLEDHDEAWVRRVRFKSTLEFVKRMDRYIEELPGRIFEPADYTSGTFTAPGEWIMARFLAYGRYPVKRRLLMVAEDIHDRFQTANIMEDEVPGTKVILKCLTSMLKIKSPLALYKDFYQREESPGQFAMAARQTLEWADVYPFLYLYGAFEGLKVSGITKHLVIDEMQDYTPIQFAVLNQIFPCQKTILGDYGQFINPNHLHTLDDLRQMYEGAEFVELNKSYRSTYEIITFARRIQNVVALEAVRRHGEEPELVQCTDRREELMRLEAAVQAFSEGGNGALGIILKTNAAAREWFEALPAACEVNLITPESATFRNGVSLTSVQMSKGLEFDEVVILDADSGTYCTDYDRSLLYIACTRAMHRLTLMYTGELTGLIDRDI